MLLSFVLLLARLWYLQVVQGSYFKERSENNRVRTQFLPPPRGKILDRNGEVLAKNRPSFDVVMYVTEVGDVQKVLHELSRLTGTSFEDLSAKYEKEKHYARFIPRILLPHVDREIIAKVKANRWRLPGIDVRYRPSRWYVHGDLAAHLIGYIREIDETQLKAPAYAAYYRSGDLVGKYGLERKWEQSLQGRRGRNNIVVNVHGVKMSDLAASDPMYQTDAIPGQSIKLTIDLDVQRAADEALKELKGGVVALDVSTGEVLAMASSPRFDPNMFIGDLSSKEWNDIVSGPGRKLNNRAMQGAYPPGSTFKVIMGAAALEEGVIDPHEKVYCPGHYAFGGRRFHCHKRSGHGNVDLKQAIIESCDVYFYVVGQRLGIDRIHEYAYRFGLGHQTGIDLAHESPGLVPSTQWKKKRFSGTEQEKWYPGETLSVVIGQGANLATPLQMAVATAAIANGGKVFKPQLLKGIYGASGTFQDESFAPEQVDELRLHQSTLALLRSAMEGVVNDPKGTARRARLPEEWGIRVAGKTGTSQVVSLAKKDSSKEYEHHAWFIGYAPAQNPEIAVAALIENGGHGGATAAPVV
ncbi:MAG: penicillin-binding protein 2, partial [Bdellovibrionales bacterium]|nr:penicillin-binding protein 2 [Bdellovibrionales bacterium]